MRKAVTSLWVAVAVLLSFGLVLVYSASVTQRGGALPFVKMQAIASFLGVTVALLLARVDYRVWAKKGIVILIAVAGFLVSISVFAFPEINGSHRWIRFAGLSLQPSEFARVGLILVMSAWYDMVGPRSSTFLKGFFYPGIVLVFLASPIVFAPDLGATIVIAVSSGVVMFAAGVRWRYLGIAVLLLVIAATLFIMSSPNRRSRVLAFVDTIQGVESTQDTAYHRNQSLEGFIRGGALGCGLGNSVQKQHYLPEANTDFIFAIAGEEFGLPATVSVVVLFAVFLCCGTYIAYHAHNRFGKFAALGLTTLISFEAAFNIGMATGCLPTKGIALPFISYGGTSLIATFIAFGLLVSIGVTSANESVTPLMRDALSDI